MNRGQRNFTTEAGSYQNLRSCRTLTIIMSKIGKNSTRVPISTEETDGTKMSSTFLQEFQNLKDNLNKFKSEDDNQDRGII